jgi:hypothetical protein
VVMETPERIYCDCHLSVVMGYRYSDGSIVWYRPEHGQRHRVKVLVPQPYLTEQRVHS